MRIGKSNHRVGRAVLLGFILGAIGIALMAYIGLEPKPYSTINDSVSDAFNATCMVEENKGGIGTGILLNTGYILTSSHVVDQNADGAIQKNERTVKVSFYNHTGVAFIRSASVVFISGNNGLSDFAILDTKEPLYSNVKFSLDAPKLGDELFTIGCTRALAPHITYGCESAQSRLGFGRASISVYVGNSGGGIFNLDQEVVGIVTAVGVDRHILNIRIPIPSKDAFTFTYGSVPITRFLPNWVEYSRTNSIYTILVERNLAFTVKRNDIKDYTALFIYLQTICQIAGVLICAKLIRQYLRQ